MTVRELIVALQAIDGDLSVGYKDPDYGVENITKVEILSTWHLRSKERCQLCATLPYAEHPEHWQEERRVLIE